VKSSGSKRWSSNWAHGERYRRDGHGADSRALFSQEDSLKPVSVMFWYQLIQWVGNLADYAEKVGDRLRLLIAR
jgi:hypothetical protein